MENDKKECRAYFLERSVYKKLFAKIQEKYAGIGHFGGTFLLNDLTKEEKEQLGGFLQKDFSGQKNVRVTAKQMEKALQSSRFCNFTWEEILELYTGRALLVKKEEKQKEEQQREAWFQNIQLRLKNPDFGRQKLFFELQLSLARKYRRSLLIHAVKAAEWLEGFWGILPERSVFHAFGGRTEMLKKVLNSGAYAAFGFSIFQNRDGAEILKTIPAERMLFETDSPYMAEIRGEENQPRLLPKIALKIAEIRGDDPERLAAQVYENSLKIAGLK